MRLGRGDNVGPGVPGDLVDHLHIDAAVGDAGPGLRQEAAERRDSSDQPVDIAILRSVHVVQVLHVRQLRECCRRVGRGFDRAKKHGVIGDGVEVERCPQLDLEPGWMLDGFPLGVSIGVVRRRHRTEGKRIERVVGVHVQVAEVRAAGGVRLGIGHEHVGRQVEVVSRKAARRSLRFFRVSGRRRRVGVRTGAPSEHRQPGRQYAGADQAHVGVECVHGVSPAPRHCSVSRCNVAVNRGEPAGAGNGRARRQLSTLAGC